MNKGDTPPRSIQDEEGYLQEEADIKEVEEELEDGEIEIEWDGSEAELVPDEDAEEFEDNFAGIKLSYVLKEDERFFSESGDLLRNAVVEASNKMDAKLIKGLYKNAVTREKFFTDTDGIAVFDKTGFGWVINNREFLPDSYTRYKNKIGCPIASYEY